MRDQWNEMLPMCVDDLVLCDDANVDCWHAQLPGTVEFLFESLHETSGIDAA